MLLFAYIEVTRHLSSFILWIAWTDFLILFQPYVPWIHPTWSSCIIPFLYLTRLNLPIFSLIEKLKFTITNYSLKKWNTKQQCGNFLVSELFIILAGRSQDGRGVGLGEHFLPHKFIKRAFKSRVNSTKQLLNAGRGHQAPRKATQVFKRR